MDIRDPLLLGGELFVPRTEEISRKVGIFLLLGYVPLLCASFESIFLSRASRDSSTAWAELDFQESGVGVRVIEELLLPKQSGCTVGESQTETTSGAAASPGPLYLQPTGRLQGMSSKAVTPGQRQTVSLIGDWEGHRRVTLAL